MDAKQLNTPKSPSITRHSQTEKNPSRRLKPDEDFQDECSIENIVKKILKLALFAIKVKVSELKKSLSLQGEEIKDLKNELLNFQEKETKSPKSEPLMNNTEEIKFPKSELLDKQNF